MAPEIDDDLEVEPPPPGPPTIDFRRGDEKRLALAGYLAMQRGLIL